MIVTVRLPRHVGAAEVHLLRRAVAELPADARAVLLEGDPDAFCLGATRELLMAEDAAEQLAFITHELPRALLSFPVPTVAAMAGHAIGGGFALGLWSDLVVLGAESMYGANFVQLGFTPGMGSTVVVEELCGAALARELLFTGRLVKGRDLPIRSRPRAEVVAYARELAEEIAAAPRSVLARLKGELAARRRARLDAALVEERRMHDELFADPETRARIAAAYGGGNL